MDLQEFGREADVVAKALRRLPADLRKALATEVQDKVAEPLGRKVAAAANGPHNYPLRTGVKARKLADPTIVIGGAKRLVSGGASIRQLVYGNEFGGGKRTTRIPARTGRRGYRRRTTNQFVPAHPFIFKTIGTNGEWVMDQFADIVDDVLKEVQ